jgi:hypothetical protein
MDLQTTPVIPIAGVPLGNGREAMENFMKLASKRTAIATLTVACAALLSFSWSEQDGVSLGVKIAEAADRAPPQMSAARTVRRHARRSVYSNEVFATAVAATTSPWHYDDYYCYGHPSAGRGAPPGSYYRSYSGGYCVSSSDVTGLYAQPTLFPRYYVGWDR